MPSPLSGELREKVRTALSEFAQPWLPCIARPITDIAWQELARHGFSRSNYGTHRWLETNPNANRLEFKVLSLGSSLDCRIEALPASSKERYERRGLEFSDRAFDKNKVAAIEASFSLISKVPSLHATVCTYLKALHVLKAPGIDYDVSSSDPEVPFSIFISVPDLEREGTLRLAESIVHECMHLHLTFIDAITPLVGDLRASAFSPWQQEVRPLKGVLHGLYVFAVIDAYFNLLEQAISLARNEEEFVAKRRCEIAQEVAQVMKLATAPGLTSAGRMLACHVLRSVID